jgi:hypothetical protein
MVDNNTPIEVLGSTGAYHDSYGSNGTIVERGLDYDEIAEEIDKRRQPLMTAPENAEARALRKPGPDEVLVLQSEMNGVQCCAFADALHRVWPGVPVLFLAPDQKLTVELVAPLITNLKKLAARNSLKDYAP